MKTKLPTDKCQAKDPSTCPYHGTKAKTTIASPVDALSYVDSHEKAPVRKSGKGKEKKPTEAQMKARQERMKKFSDEIQAGFDQPRSQEYMDFLGTVSSFHNYSPTNQMLITLQAPNASVVAGYKKWQKDYDRTVKKGEHAIYIYAPSRSTKPMLDQAGNPMVDANGNERTVQRTYFRLVPVFSDIQTEGKPLPHGDIKLNETAPAGFRTDLENALNDSGFTVSYEDTGLKGGWTNFGTKQVVIDKNADETTQVSTLAHEFGHIAAGHDTQTAEYHTDEGGHRGRMEVEAESIAYALCRSNGMSSELSNNSSQYIKSWAHSDNTDSEEIMKKVSTTVHDVLDKFSWRNV